MAFGRKEYGTDLRELKTTGELKVSMLPHSTIPPPKAKVKVAQSCPTFCDFMEWVAFPFSRGSSPRDPTQVSHTAGGFFTSWATGKPKNTGVGGLSLLQWIFPTQEPNRVSCTAGGFFTNWAIGDAQPVLKSRVMLENCKHLVVIIGYWRN